MSKGIEVSHALCFHFVCRAHRHESGRLVVPDCLGDSVSLPLVRVALWLSTAKQGDEILGTNVVNATRWSSVRVKLIERTQNA